MIFEVWSVAKLRKTCRSRKMLQHEKLVAKIDFDTAENGLPKDTSSAHLRRKTNELQILEYTNRQIPLRCERFNVLPYISDRYGTDP